MLKHKKNEPALMNTTNSTFNDECILLYSYDEIKTFLEVAYKFQTCTIKSVVMDGQKVFIIKFEDYCECLSLINEAPSLADASPTLLGCLALDLVKMEDESTESMRNYLEELETEKAIAYLATRKHHAKITKRGTINGTRYKY